MSEFDKMFQQIVDDFFGQFFIERESMKPLEFLIWLRDEVKIINHSKEGNCLDTPSNGELRRWIKKGCLFTNGKIIGTDDMITFPVNSLILFPKNTTFRCTIIEENMK